jgi:hypothetical protein
MLIRAYAFWLDLDRPGNFRPSTISMSKARDWRDAMKHTGQGMCYTCNYDEAVRSIKRLAIAKVWELHTAWDCLLITGKMTGYPIVLATVAVIIPIYPRAFSQICHPGSLADVQYAEQALRSIRTRLAFWVLCIRGDYIRRSKSCWQYRERPTWRGGGAVLAPGQAADGVSYFGRRAAIALMGRAGFRFILQNIGEDQIAFLMLENFPLPGYLDTARHPDYGSNLTDKPRFVQWPSILTGSVWLAIWLGLAYMMLECSTIGSHYRHAGHPSNTSWKRRPISGR